MMQIAKPTKTDFFSKQESNKIEYNREIMSCSLTLIKLLNSKHLTNSTLMEILENVKNTEDVMLINEVVHLISANNLSLHKGLSNIYMERYADLISEMNNTENKIDKIRLLAGSKLTMYELNNFNEYTSSNKNYTTAETKELIYALDNYFVNQFDGDMTSQEEVYGGFIKYLELSKTELNYNEFDEPVCCVGQREISTFSPYRAKTIRESERVFKQLGDVFTFNDGEYKFIKKDSKKNKDYYSKKKYYGIPKDLTCCNLSTRVCDSGQIVIDNFLFNLLYIEGDSLKSE